jgi:hypothetical protein
MGFLATPAHVSSILTRLGFAFRQATDYIFSAPSF